MPKKSSAPKSKSSDVQFINYNLSTEQKKIIKESEFDLEDFFNVLEKLADSYYKIAFSFDNWNKCYSAFLTPTGDDHPNKGYVLSGRGSTPFKAFKQLVWVHHHIFDTDWTTYQGQGNAEIDD